MNFTRASTSDLETEGHVVVYVTFVISACICPTAMIFLFRKFFWARDFILTIATCVTLTIDLETQGHVMVYVTFVISACMCPTLVNLVLFCQVFRLRNSL